MKSQKVDDKFLDDKFLDEKFFAEPPPELFIFIFLFGVPPLRSTTSAGEIFLGQGISRSFFGAGGIFISCPGPGREYFSSGLGRPERIQKVEKS